MEGAVRAMLCDIELLNIARRAAVEEGEPRLVEIFETDG